MKTKRQYVPANVRKGFTVKQALEFMSGRNYTAPFTVEVYSFGHGRDVNGNGTAHYRCALVSAEDICVLHIVESGARREQVGYGCGNEAALVALEKLGYEVDTSKASSDDYRGVAVYPLLNFPHKSEA